MGFDSSPLLKGTIFSSSSSKVFGRAAALARVTSPLRSDFRRSSLCALTADEFVQNRVALMILAIESVNSRAGAVRAEFQKRKESRSAGEKCCRPRPFRKGFATGLTHASGRSPITFGGRLPAGSQFASPTRLLGTLALPSVSVGSHFAPGWR